MWRQGDLLIQKVDSIPKHAKRRKKKVVLESASTGHRHKFQDQDLCRLFEDYDQFYVEIYGDQASLVHPEHHAIELGRGMYRIWRQREFADARTRFVLD